MYYKLINAQFIRITDASFMHEIQADGSVVQQYKKAFFYVEIETEKGVGVFVLHASCNEEKEFKKFLVEHHRMQSYCCACGESYDETGIYCSGFNQDTLRYLFEHVQQHPRIKEHWEIEKQAL